MQDLDLFATGTTQHGDGGRVVGGGGGGAVCKETRQQRQQSFNQLGQGLGNDVKIGRSRGQWGWLVCRGVQVGGDHMGEENGTETLHLASEVWDVEDFGGGGEGGDQLEMDGIDGGGHRCCGRHREEGGWTQLNAPAGDGRD